MTDAPTRVTDQFLDVLEAFLDANGRELHGWAITKASQRSGPTVYKILERLTDMGWVTARWEVPDQVEEGRPRRRYYLLTGEGATRARGLIAERRPSEDSGPRSATRRRPVR